MVRKQIDFEAAKKDPSRVFEHPADVLRAESLSMNEKRDILRVWEEDARELQVAAEENMGGGEPDRLQDVLEARAALEPCRPDSGSAHGGKQGYH
ncbi:MAG: hypothetical protein Q8P46_08485 [Hyphomicrobiales bacterium]|nr:hypothetical protein [Hyphomicrobiales bacterium]